jgi:hypothetical protein
MADWHLVNISELRRFVNGLRKLKVAGWTLGTASHFLFLGHRYMPGIVGQNNFAAIKTSSG